MARALLFLTRMHETSKDVLTLSFTDLIRAGYGKREVRHFLIPWARGLADIKPSRRQERELYHLELLNRVALLTGTTDCSAARCN